MKRNLLFGLCVLLATVLISRQNSWAQGPIAATQFANATPTIPPPPPPPRIATATLSPTLVTTLASIALATPSVSAVLTVNTLEDLDTGKCDASKCSLRDAIAVAPDGATIQFAPGLTGTIFLSKGPTTLEGEITFTKNLTINGPGPKSSAIIIDGQGKFPIFQIDGPGNVTINTLQMQNANGGAIDDRGTNVQITQSTFLNNHATAGGAIFVETGTVTIIGSTFEGNSGSAIFNWQGHVVVVNSTFQDNGKKSADAGAISNSSEMSITNSTLTGNGGVEQVIGNGGHLTIQNSILVNTLFPTKTCGNPITDGGNNLEYPVDTCKFIRNAIHADPKLGPLTDNGGPTKTIALQAGSAAIGKGDQSACATIIHNTDQRNMALTSTGTCDIGAYQSMAILHPGTN